MSPTMLGARLGMYQANALGGIGGAAATLLFLDPKWPALIYVVLSGFGWAGWWRDYRLAVRVSDEQIRAALNGGSKRARENKTTAKGNYPTNESAV